MVANQSTATPKAPQATSAAGGAGGSEAGSGGANMAPIVIIVVVAVLLLCCTAVATLYARARAHSEGMSLPRKSHGNVHELSAMPAAATAAARASDAALSMDGVMETQLNYAECEDVPLPNTAELEYASAEYASAEYADAGTDAPVPGGAIRPRKNTQFDPPQQPLDYEDIESAGRRPTQQEPPPSPDYMLPTTPGYITDLGVGSPGPSPLGAPFAPTSPHRDKRPPTWVRPPTYLEPGPQSSNSYEEPAAQKQQAHGQCATYEPPLEQGANYEGIDYEDATYEDANYESVGIDAHNAGTGGRSSPPVYDYDALAQFHGPGRRAAGGAKAVPGAATAGSDVYAVMSHADANTPADEDTGLFYSAVSDAALAETERAAPGATQLGGGNGATDASDASDYDVFKATLPAPSGLSAYDTFGPNAAPTAGSGSGSGSAGSGDGGAGAADTDTDTDTLGKSATFTGGAASQLVPSTPMGQSPSHVYEAVTAGAEGEAQADDRKGSRGSINSIV